MTRVINQPYLQTARAFPEERQQFYQQINKAYVDIANCVNNRVVSTFPATVTAITGEEWFITGNRKQQGLRQVYTFTSIPATIPHGIVFADIERFVRIYGVFTDGTIWYPLPWVDVVAVNNQVKVNVDSININITGGGGAQQPVATKGTVVLEWLSQP